MAQPDTDLTAERDRIDQQMAALSRQTPEKAKQLVEEADRLMAKRDDEFEELRKKRDAIDQQFQITAQKAADAKSRERREARQAAVNELLALHEGILHSAETAEAHLTACVQAIQAALEASKEANQLTRQLSNGEWSSFQAQQMTNFFSAEFSRTMIKVGKKQQFGLHCVFREPMEPIRGGKYLASWRERAEKETATAIGYVLAELS